MCPFRDTNDDILWRESQVITRERIETPLIADKQFIYGI